MAGASYAELLDILEARLVIEVELLRNSIRQGDDEWQKRTLLSHRNLSRAPELRRGMSEPDYSQWESAHRDFHLELVSASGQLWLGRFLVQLDAQVCRHQRLIVMGKRPLADPRADQALAGMLRSNARLEHHTLLMDAALDRDEARAVALLQDHIGVDLSPDLEQRDPRALPADPASRVPAAPG